MTEKLGFFVGSVASPAVQHLTTNLGWMLSWEYDLSLITTRPEKFESVTSYFRITGGAKPQTIQGSASALNEYLSTNSPVVITQLTQPPTHGSLVGMLARRYNIPFVYRYSGDRFYGYRVRRGWRKWGTFALDNVIGRLPLYLAAEYIALGPAGKCRLVVHGVNSEQITVLPPSIDPSRFQGVLGDSPDIDIPDDRYVALFLGRCNRLKGLETLERTIPTIIDRRDDIQFVLVGSGEEIPTLPEEYQDHMTVVGYVAPETISGYLHRADVLVHPSLTEGVPRALLEALFSGTPVVARAVGDVPFVTDNTFITDDEFIELVCDFENLPVDDPSGFAREELKVDYLRFYSKFS